MVPCLISQSTDIFSALSIAKIWDYGFLLVGFNAIKNRILVTELIGNYIADILVFNVACAVA